ncbi:MAG: Bug family tripartite tricarboxylate transporter substrate binding protein [Burkholderiales bacterium]
MTRNRSTIQTALTMLLAPACLATSGFVLAQGAFPNKPVRLIVPFAVGGPTDNAARLIAPHISAAMGQQFLVDNRAGAATRVGMDAAAKAAPDGYTLGMVAFASAANVTLYADMPYDLLRDLRGVAFLSRQPVLLAVNPGRAAVSSVREFIDFAKKNPGTTFGFQGYGGAVHLLIEELNQAHGTGITLVPYKGAAEPAAALAGDQVHSFAGSFAAFTPYKGNPKVRILAVTGTDRIPGAPSAPTFAEAGYEDLGRHFAWFGVVAPAATPNAVVDYLNRTINAAVVKVLDRFSVLDFRFQDMTPAQFDAFIRSEVVRIGAIIRKGNIKPE